MAIIRRGEDTSLARRAREWDPFRAMQELMSWEPRRELLPRPFRGEERTMFVPEVDLKETKDAYVFTVDLPGVKENDVELSVTGGRLTFSGRREAEKSEETDAYYYSERTYGGFLRSFALPEDVDASQISAELKDGVLTVRAPKGGESKTKKIAIGSGSKERKEVKA